MEGIWIEQNFNTYYDSIPSMLYIPKVSIVEITIFQFNQ